MCMSSDERTMDMPCQAKATWGNFKTFVWRRLILLLLLVHNRSWKKLDLYITKWHAYSHGSVGAWWAARHVSTCHAMVFSDPFDSNLQCLCNVFAMSLHVICSRFNGFHEFSMFASHCWHFEAVRSRPFARSLAECRAQLDHLASTFTMKLQLFLRALEEKRRNGRRKLQFCVKHVKHK